MMLSLFDDIIICIFIAKEKSKPMWFEIYTLKERRGLLELPVDMEPRDEMYVISKEHVNEA